MKLIGFSQLYNENAKGNLQWWLPMMSSICDYVYVFDQGSTDGSDQMYLQYPNVVVTHSPTNRFAEELICKQELLDRVYSDHPDVSWILWLDGDTMITCPSDLRTVIRFDCNTYAHSRGIRYEHYNLWRSDTRYRTDNNYHWLARRRVPLWNCTTFGKLKFDTSPGLHKIQKPVGINEHSTAFSSTCSLLHRGFATDQQIIGKYDTYKGFGQTGNALDRILDETGLTTMRLPTHAISPLFTTETDPKTLTPIRQIYDRQH